jgi:hypothetical protein
MPLGQGRRAGVAGGKTLFTSTAHRIPLRFSVMQSAAAARPRADRRRFPRFDLVGAGRVLDSRAGFEQTCRILNVSAGGALIKADASIPSGADVMLYVDDFGRLPSKVCRPTYDGAFGVRFNITPQKTERLIETITWRLNAHSLGLAASEHRRMQRYPGRDDIEVLIDGGGTLTCSVLDFSMVGVALATKKQRPPIDAWVQVGNSYGRVARYIAGGFCVDFAPKALRHR